MTGRSSHRVLMHIRRSRILRSHLGSISRGAANFMQLQQNAPVAVSRLAGDHRLRLRAGYAPLTGPTCVAISASQSPNRNFVRHRLFRLFQGQGQNPVFDLGGDLLLIDLVRQREWSGEVADVVFGIERLHALVLSRIDFRLDPLARRSRRRRRSPPDRPPAPPSPRSARPRFRRCRSSERNSAPVPSVSSFETSSFFSCGCNACD